MKALIIDGEEIFRLSMKEVVSVVANFDEIVEAGCEHDFITTTASHDFFDLIILQPGSLDDGGDNCLSLAKRLYPKTTIVCIGHTHATNTAFIAGVTNVDRKVSVREMITVIRRALHLPVESYNGGLRGSDSGRMQAGLQSEFDQFRHGVMENQARDGQSPADLTRLSHRQREILAMAADGLPNKEIAARLNIAEGTVKAHMHSIFKVLGVSNRTQAVIRYGASGGRVESQTNSGKPKYRLGNHDWHPSTIA